MRTRSAADAHAAPRAQVPRYLLRLVFVFVGFFFLLVIWARPLTFPRATDDGRVNSVRLRGASRSHRVPHCRACERAPGQVGGSLRQDPDAAAR